MNEMLKRTQTLAQNNLYRCVVLPCFNEETFLDWPLLFHPIFNSGKVHAIYC